MKLSKYLAFFTLSFMRSIRNWKMHVGLGVFLVTCLCIFANLWKVAAAKAGVHYSADQLLWYIALNEWVLVSIPLVHEVIEDDYHSGKLAYLLQKPISYLGAVFTDALGALSAQLMTLGAITFIFTYLQVGFPSLGFIELVLTGLLALGAGILGILFLMSIGFLSFWLQDVTPLYWLWEKLLFMLGGLLLPLSIYPSWLQTVAAYTPFPVILGQRSGLVLDSSTAQFTEVGLGLALWTFLTLALLLTVYKKSLRILEVEGG